MKEKFSFIDVDGNEHRVSVSVEWLKTWDPTISTDNAEIAGATDEELISELEKRGYGVFNKNGTYRDVVKTILPVSCGPYIDGIMETNQIDIGPDDFFLMKAPKRWWDAPYGLFEEKDEEMEENNV